MMRITPMVKNILIINLAIFLIQSFFNLQLNDIFGLKVIYSDQFAPYQFFTYMWLHGDFRHILYNMMMLFFMAPLLEQVWGSKRFLIFYLACGIGAGVLYGTVDATEKYSLKQDTEAFLANPNAEDFSIYIAEHTSMFTQEYRLSLMDFKDEYYKNENVRGYNDQAVQIVDKIYEVTTNSNMIGASGAIYGILMAMFLLFPNMQVLLMFMFPVKLKYVVFGLTLFEIYSEFNRSAGDNVAHLAHLSGMIIAFFLVKKWQKNSNRFY